MQQCRSTSHAEQRESNCLKRVCYFVFAQHLLCLCLTSHQQLRSYGDGPRLKFSSDRLTKPGIGPATPGLQGKWFTLHHRGFHKYHIVYICCTANVHNMRPVKIAQIPNYVISSGCTPFSNISRNIWADYYKIIWPGIPIFIGNNFTINARQNYNKAKWLTAPKTTRFDVMEIKHYNVSFSW